MTEPATLMVTQELQHELDTCKEDMAALEVEVEEMRGKLKKLAKEEKTAKGHNAMTEELKKMEAETGLSVSFVKSMYEITWRDCLAISFTADLLLELPCI